MPPSEEHEEIIRARERLHKLEGSAIALTGRLRIVEQRLDRIEPSVEALQLQERLAAEVADKVRELRGQLFTRAQKAGGLAVGLVALADFVRGLTMH